MGRRFGVRPFPWADPSPDDCIGVDHRQLFDTIHSVNFWQSQESISGAGSTKERTAEYAASLVQLLRTRRLQSLFDAPCGDLNWMSDVVDRTGIAYIGGDVSSVAVEAARACRSDLDIRLFDIRTDEFPQTDVWHCRDCLFHLSFADGLGALRNFARSQIPFALITTNSGLWVRNLDIETGGHRVTDLERAPYNLPRPLVRIRDFPRGVEFPRYVALWTREAIAGALHGSRAD